MSLNEESALADAGHGKVPAWVVMDQVLFEIAVEHVSHYDSIKRNRGVSEKVLKYWRVADAAACILLVCAAMEAHANYLVREAIEGRMPDHLGLTATGWESLERLPVRCKWLKASKTVTGRDVLHRGVWPFQGFCEAVKRRNHFIGHPKMVAIYVSDPSAAPKAEDFPEVKELTIDNARKALDAAKATVREVYRAIPKDPPAWAAEC